MKAGASLSVLMLVATKIDANKIKIRTNFGERAMGLLSKLFRTKTPSLKKPTGEVKTSGELITEVTNGANLVDGKPTWEHTKEKKHDIDFMKRCCDAELTTTEKTGLIPAPYYFERVAILSRKEKNYAQEIAYCEKYIDAVESVCKTTSIDERENKRAAYTTIAQRLPKAKELLAKSNQNA